AIVGRGLTAEAAQGRQAPCDRPPAFAVSPETKPAARQRQERGALHDDNQTKFREINRSERALGVG
nr:hypothetical protein [Kofleriaceae bacterium]